jgi:serine/threonine protein kinase/tetratricopeptide (TPR) repeat protein
MTTPHSSPSNDRPPPRTSWVEDRLAEIAEERARGVADALESLIASHPEWDDESAIRLIYEELCERRDGGEDATTREVVERFPRYREELAMLLDFDRLVRANSRPVEFPEVGDHLGPFLLVGELGRGASGRAFLAEEGGLANRPVVLKVQPIDQDEHLTLAQLQNTHIIPLFSEHSFGERGLRALCMPYLGGACLDRLLDDLAAIPPRSRKGRDLLEAIERVQPMEVGQPDSESPCRLYLEGESWTRAVCWIAACLADGLHSAHARGLIHMDLKPSNVLIAGDGLPLLLDFHLARQPLRAGEVVEGRVGGTPGWMSPEQRQAFEAAKHRRPSPHQVDGRCDIHALGLLLSFALDGRTEPGEPYPDASWTPENPEVSPALVEVVRRCLATSPSERYSSAASLADDLRRHLDDLPLKGVPNRSLRERWAKWRRRRPGSLARLFVGSAGIGAIATTLAILGTDHLRRLADADESLAIGRALMMKRHHVEAVSAYSRGLARVEGRLDGGRAHTLREGLVQAKLGQQADELHRLAESMRFRFGVDPPDAAVARLLAELLPSIWDGRDLLLNWASRSGDRALFERVRTDLQELAFLWADVRVRSSSGADRSDERPAALNLLVEAGATCGRSPSLRRQVREIRRSLGLPAASDEGEEPPPADAWEHYDLGRYHLRASRFAPARAEFEIASRERPQDFWPCFYLGLCAYRLDRFDEATAAFRVCEALAPASAECSYNHALALEAQGRLDLAWSSYARAISLEPGLAPARLNRGILSFRRGDYPAAIADYDEASRTADDPSIRQKAKDYREIAASRMGRPSGSDVGPAAH